MSPRGDSLSSIRRRKAMLKPFSLAYREFVVRGKVAPEKLILKLGDSYTITGESLLAAHHCYEELEHLEEHLKQEALIPTIPPKPVYAPEGTLLERKNAGTWIGRQLAKARYLAGGSKEGDKEE